VTGFTIEIMQDAQNNLIFKLGAIVELNGPLGGVTTGIS
jgi:hypothetical protein